MKLKFYSEPLKNQLKFNVNRISKYSFMQILQKICLKLIGILLWVVFLPITFLLHMLGFRRVNVFSERIGHLAMEPDCLIKEQELGRIIKRKWILTAPIKRTANEHLIKYWKEYFLIIQNPLACFFLESVARWGVASKNIKHYLRNISRTQDAYSINKLWGTRPPILKLTEEDNEWGLKQLSMLGIPLDAWFVCLHVREEGFSLIDDEIQKYRNASIENTFLAINEIVRRGGWVIRMGDKSSSIMPDMCQAVDYAHHFICSSRLDIFLLAKARFILGNTSGIALVGSVFGTPCALANMSPITAMGFTFKDISIPKLLMSKRKNKLISIIEARNLGLASAQFTQQYKSAGVELLENSPQDILELTIEMFDSLDKCFSSKKSKSENLELKIGDYAFLSASKIGQSFLKRYRAYF